MRKLKIKSGSILFYIHFIDKNKKNFDNTRGWRGCASTGSPVIAEEA